MSFWSQSFSFLFHFKIKKQMWEELSKKIKTVCFGSHSSSSIRSDLLKIIREKKDDFFQIVKIWTAGRKQRTACACIAVSSMFCMKWTEPGAGFFLPAGGPALGLLGRINAPSISTSLSRTGGSENSPSEFSIQPSISSLLLFPKCNLLVFGSPLGTSRTPFQSLSAE